MIPLARTLSAACPSCGRPTPHRWLYVKNASRVFRCTGCGLGNASKGDFVPEAYYTSAYFDGGHHDGYADYVGSEAVLRAEFRAIVDLLRNLKPQGGTLLEVGSAYGFFLMEARHDFRVHGIELSQDAVASARRQGLTSVHCGAPNEAVLASIGKLDVVVMLDVIEHLEEPFETLSMLARSMSDDALLVLTTGNFSSLVAKLMGRHWRLMTPPQHLWFFSRRSIELLADRLGLRIERIEAPWKRVPLSLALYQLGRIIGLKLPAGLFGWANGIGLPINLFDAMRVVLRKAESSPPSAMRGELII